MNKTDYGRAVDVAEISRPAKGRFRKIRRQRRGAPQSAAILRAKLGGRREEGGREEEMRNLKIMPGSDEIDVRDYITASHHTTFSRLKTILLPRAPRTNNLSKVKPEIEKRRREGEWRTGRKPRVYLWMD